MTEAELRDFTARRSLPNSYVREFMAKVHHTASLKRPWRYPWLRREEPGGGGLRFTDFARFVNAKEGALRESFQKIGALDADEAKGGLRTRLDCWLRSHLVVSGVAPQLYDPPHPPA